MSFFVWLMLGLVIGYLARLIMRCEADCGALLGTVAGILGAMIAGRLLAPLVGGVPGQSFFTVSAVLVSLLGAVALVAAVNLLRRGGIRYLARARLGAAARARAALSDSPSAKAAARPPSAP
jgi:uncharacterized membrane protein YeaQ/YmgE (transglycosylase-associated protein family)